MMLKKKKKKVSRTKKFWSSCAAHIIDISTQLASCELLPEEMESVFIERKYTLFISSSHTF